jgi:TetR/AcrR family tetracycline transcriptional repressor
VRGYQLIYSFTIGFCIEEQAVAQAGDDRYSLENRAERVGAGANPPVAEAGPVIFGDPGTRFADLAAILVDAVGRLRTVTS